MISPPTCALTFESGCPRLRMFWCMWSLTVWGRTGPVSFGRKEVGNET
jgi:hypothetical protein